MRFALLLASFLLLVGCKDPYADFQSPSGQPPQKTEKSASSGSLQALYQRQSQKIQIEVERWKVAVGLAPTKGPQDGLVTVVEFSDFQCPFCSRGAKFIEDALKKYPGKVRVAFKHYPLDFHKEAHLAAQASMAAHEQGKFWEYHDKLFANMKKLFRPDLESYAAELKLDLPKFKAALDSGKYKGLVDSDMGQGSSVKVQGTPTAYVNGRQLSSLTAEELNKTIEDEIERLANPPADVKGLKGDALYNKLIENGKSQDAPAEARKSDAEPSADEVKNVAVGEAPIFGPDDAPVTIIEFSDFECPFCSRGAKTAKQVVKGYKGKVRLAFKHFPLNFHPFAKLASQASMAAHEQGKFWEYHDKLFANQKALDRFSLLNYARDLGLDTTRFEVKMDSPETAAVVSADTKQGSEVGVRGTPAFFVNGRFINGAQPFSGFKKLIDEELLKRGFKKEDLGEEPGTEIDISRAPTKGPQDALATIVEFSDFQCPFCSKAARTVEDVLKAYKGRVRVAFKHYPLNFHKEAHLAAQASMAAHEQGKFWEYHDKLFANMKKLFRPDLESYAAELGIKLGPFRDALDSGKYKGLVDTDLAQGSEVGVNGTPSFFVEGQKVENPTFGGLSKAINPILLKKGIPASELPSATEIPVKGAPLKGGPNALVTVVEFSDFECPFCSKAAATLKELHTLYGDKIRIFFKHYPLDFHKKAHLAAQAAMAAQEQGKFWEYHDKLFANMRALDRPDLERYASELGINLVNFRQSLDSGLYKEAVDNDMRDGERFAVQGTPSFFVNNKRVDSPTLDALKKAIDEEFKLLSPPPPAKPTSLPNVPSLVPAMPDLPGLPPARR